MYGINGKIDPPKKKWPSDRAEALRHIVEKNSADIFNTSDVLAASLTEEKITNVEVKQLELALTSDTLRKLLNRQRLKLIMPCFQLKNAELQTMMQETFLKTCCIALMLIMF